MKKFMGLLAITGIAFTNTVQAAGDIDKLNFSVSNLEER